MLSFSLKPKIELTLKLKVKPSLKPKLVAKLRLVLSFLTLLIVTTLLKHLALDSISVTVALSVFLIHL